MKSVPGTLSRYYIQSNTLGLDLKVDMLSGINGSVVAVDESENQELKGWQKIKVTYPIHHISP